MTGRIGELARKHRRALLWVGVLALVSVVLTLAAGTLLAVRKAKVTARHAIDERDQARQAADELKRQLAQVEAAQHAAEKERGQALDAKDKAERFAEDAQAVLDFLRDKLLPAGHPPNWTGDPRPNVTLREALDEAEPQVAEAFAGRPLAEATVRNMLGSAYFHLGAAELAVKQYEQALALRQANLGRDDPAVIACRNELARAYRLDGRADEAGRLYDQ